MPAGTIITVLQSIPWGDVLTNAPVVVDSARRLWESVANRPKPAELASTGAVGASAEQVALAELTTRTAALETTIAQLQEQMQASSDLIRALAEQNTQMIQRIEANRVRLKQLTIATGTFAVATVALALFFLLRSAA